MWDIFSLLVPMMVEIDRRDRQILDLMQKDVSLSVAELAERVGLSQNACWRRARRLQDDGVIRRRVALLDQDLLDLSVTVYVSVKTSEHNETWLKRFSKGVHEIPEVVEFYRMSGDTDYLLKIIVRDIAHYDRVYKQLVTIAPLYDVSSSFAMERIKYTTALPLSDG